MRVVPRVVICGGGVAAIEALLALREMLVLAPHINLIAPNPSFVYQPMAVAEPFGQAQSHVFDMKQVASELDAHVHPETVAAVDAEERCVELANGVRMSYDAAIVAVGARRVEWLAGALSFGGADDTGAFSELLERVEHGQVSRLAFTAPSGMSWTLPLYELALLTAARLAERGIAEVELTIVTPEKHPLAIFGATAGEMLRQQLLDRGIRIAVGVTAEKFGSGRLALCSGATLEVDEVVALPRLAGPRISGLPLDADGFIEIDEHCRVAGLEAVYAAGDGTTFPIKQGGIATQQADVAAECIAAELGASRQLPVFTPTLRGMLLTGVAPMFLRAAVHATEAGSGDVAGNAMWWPPTKIAGRYLSPYLAHLGTLGGRASLEDRPPSTQSLAASREAHKEARELALTFALADARAGHYQSALSWLEVIERLEGVMPADCLQIRDEWTAQAGNSGSHV
ncbi:MAG TPA: FAD-dependent oxidoreductase [Solirubrobacteraceae bacterium]|nr:FAD-dependent oxidoreductase [Solirubrobacteraceae bacterium]